MRDKPLILAVDDNAQNLQVMEAMLVSQGYLVELAENGEEALRIVETDPPDLILLDAMMPGLDGFEVTRRIKSRPDSSGIPIVMVTALTQMEDRVRALEAGADEFLNKPVDKTEIRARVRSLLKVKDYNDHMVHHQRELEAEVASRTKELEEAFRSLKSANKETIVRLSRAAEYKDSNTGSHILRMSNYAAIVALELGYADKAAEDLLVAAPMHDIGKIGIPDRVLLKAGALDDDEWAIMKRHCEIGFSILSGSDSDFISLGATIAYTHHEKWDGTGYPNRLGGENIPLAGRIITIADVFDALSSRRPYKAAFSLETSFGIIREGRGRHFDPQVVDAFFGAQDRILAVMEKFQDA
jgi:putative two-component system response regulator